MKNVIRVGDVGICLLLSVGFAHAAETVTLVPTHLPEAASKSEGMPVATLLSPELREVVVARGSMPVEGPDLEFTSYYGYNNDGAFVAPPGSAVEASKTEPDKNTYLVLKGQHGPDKKYRYGTHFLFQGHESGLKSAGGLKRGYITRLNLDSDEAHRVTLLAGADKDGQALPTFDGSMWYPFSQRLLFTAELGDKGGVWQATPDYPATVEPLHGIFGTAGYEGIQSDDQGTVWLVEDVKTDKGAKAKNALQPSGFVYRLIPKDKADLSKGGTLQALQIVNADGVAIEFHAGQADADILSGDNQQLYSYGTHFKTHWVTLHDTATDGMQAFDANAYAKQKHATPFKRPENGMFRPGSKFTEFVFTVTGDTDARTEATDHGGFGGLMKITQASAAANEGTISLVLRGDAAHTGFDNLAFWSAHELVVAEDAGDKLHTQRGRFDSLYLIDLRKDYSQPGIEPVRIMAQGRDMSATIDSKLLELKDAYDKATMAAKDKERAAAESAQAGADTKAADNKDCEKHEPYMLLGMGGFLNDGDNEITGIHIFDGDASVKGQIGAVVPRPFRSGWRVFYTQQHGDNTTYEILPR